MQQYDSCGVWYSFGDCPDSSGLRRTIACLLSRSLHTLDRRTLHRAPTSITSIHPTPIPRKSAAKRESCRNTQIIGPSPARVNPIALRRIINQPPKLRRASPEVSCFLNLRPYGIEFEPGKRPCYLAIGLLFIERHHADRDS